MRGELLTRILGFAALPAVSALSPLIALPLLVRTGGASGWAAIAVGQSIGTAGSIICQWGWGSAGPTLVAASPYARRVALYRESLLIRTVLTLVALPLVCVCAAVLAPTSYSLTAALSAASTVSLALSCSWYWIGEGAPRLIAVYETVPRLVATLSSAVLAYGVGSIVVFPAMMLAFTLLIGFAGSLKIVRSSRGTRMDRDQVWPRFREQAALALSAAVSAGYTSLALPLVALSNPAAVPMYAALDRVANLARVGLTPVRHAFQGWVVVAGTLQRRRLKTAFAASATIGLAVGICYAFGLPIADTILFGSHITVTLTDSLVGGLVLLAVAASGCLIFCALIPMGRYQVVTVATVAGSLVGIPCIFMLSRELGALGALLGLAAAESVVLAIAAVVVVRASRFWGRVTSDAAPSKQEVA